MAKPSSPPHTSHPWARHVLAILAILGTLFTFITTFSLLQAGTLQLDGGHLIFSSLAPVSFHGIIPSPSDIYVQDSSDVIPGQPQLFQLEGDGTNSTITWQVKISLFINAFGFEWPHATKWQNGCGIMRNVNGVLPSSPAARLPADLAIAGRYLGLEEEEYGCLLPGARYPCTNAVFRLWEREMRRNGDTINQDWAYKPQKEFSMTGPSSVFYVVLCALVGMAVMEGLMRWRPKLFRCSCLQWYRNKQGWCVCWKDEDGPTLHAGVRNRIRVRQVKTLEVLYMCGIVWTLVQAWGLKRFVDRMDPSFGGGMQPTMGMGFVAASLAGVMGLVVADICLVARAKMSVDEEERRVPLLDHGAPNKADEVEDDREVEVEGLGDDAPLIAV